MSMRDRIRAFLQSQADAFPDLAEKYQEFGVLQSKKLWHELTQALLSFVENPANARGDNFVRLYDEFIRRFETKMNQLDLVKIVIKVAVQHHPQGSAEELERAIAFLQGISGCRTRAPDETKAGAAASTVTAEAAGDDSIPSKLGTKDAARDDGESKVSTMNVDPSTVAQDENGIDAQKRRKLGEDAYIVVQAYVGRVRLQQQQYRDCKHLLADCKSILAKLTCADPAVHAAVYRLASEFHKVRGPAAEYYSSTLQLLAYTPEGVLEDAETLAIATDLSLAALIGEGIYNFGEVLNLPIFSRLEESKEYEWLSTMMRCFCDGDIEGFNALVSERSSEIAQQPALAAPQNIAFLKEKIALLALVQLVFSLESHDRVVSFAAVARVTRLGTDRVESLAMRAMSLGLMKGSIDQVAQTLTVTWVMPRVLDQRQLASVRQRLEAWGEKVHESALFIDGNTAELFDASIAIGD
jgi:26S proteasome regulatory subunit N9